MGAYYTQQNTVMNEWLQMRFKLQSVWSKLCSFPFTTLPPPTNLEARPDRTQVAIGRERGTKKEPCISDLQMSILGLTAGPGQPWGPWFLEQVSYWLLIPTCSVENSLFSSSFQGLKTFCWPLIPVDESPLPSAGLFFYHPLAWLDFGLLLDIGPVLTLDLLSLTRVYWSPPVFWFQGDFLYDSIIKPGLLFSRATANPLCRPLSPPDWPSVLVDSIPSPKYKNWAFWSAILLWNFPADPSASLCRSLDKVMTPWTGF